MALLILLVVASGLMVGGFYAWARGLPATQSSPARRRVPLVTEAVAYIGAILLLAGFGAAVGQRWTDITSWGRVAVFTSVAVVFLTVGALVRRVPEPAVQRMVAVVWLLSVGAATPAAGLAAHEVLGWTGGPTATAIGTVVSGYGGTLWFVRRRALQHLALFAGLIVLLCGVIVTVTHEHASPLAFTFTLWPFALGWAVLGWRRYLPPLWVAVPLGVAVALLSPSVSVADHGWVYLVAIGTAAAVMAASVAPRNPVLLAQGAVAMFGYVTSAVIRYFGDSLGVPATLMIAGLLILALAVVSTRLMRPPRQPAAGTDPGPRQAARTSQR